LPKLEKNIRILPYFTNFLLNFLFNLKLKERKKRVEISLFLFEEIAQFPNDSKAELPQLENS